MALVHAYARMMPQIEAGEHLDAIANGAMATGSMARIDAQRRNHRLQQASAGVKRGRAAKATPAALGRIGIGVRTVPAKPIEKDLSDG